MARNATKAAKMILGHRFSDEQEYAACANGVAAAYLAERSDTKLTRKFLRSLGSKPVPSDMGPNYEDHEELCGLNLWDFNGRWWHVRELDRYPIRTRGQLLALLRGLGIPLPTAHAR